LVGATIGNFTSNIYDVSDGSCIKIPIPTLFEGIDEISIRLSSDLLLIIQSSDDIYSDSILKVYDINTQSLLYEKTLNETIASATVHENSLYLFYIPDGLYTRTYEKMDLSTFEITEFGENFLPIGRDNIIRFFESDFFEDQLIIPEEANSSVFLRSPGLLNISSGAIDSNKEIVSELYIDLSNNFGCDFRLDLMARTKDLQYAVYKFPYGRCVTSPSGSYNGVAVFDLREEKVYFFDSGINVSTIAIND